MRFERATTRNNTGLIEKPHLAARRPGATARRSHLEFLAPIARRICASRSKRALDVAVAGTLLLLLAPLFAAVAVAVKLTSPGPVFFWQQRYGAARNKFWICKFRSMRVMESVGDFSQASRSDSRLTPVGSWLRRSSIDELPQLLNVLEGSMSLVGPRPHAVVMDDHFAHLIPGLPSRHLVRPGITGLAQVSGHRGPTDSFEAMSERVRKDVEYIRTWSFSKDVVILLRTPAALLRTRAF